MMSPIGTKLQILGLLAFSFLVGLGAESAFAQRGGRSGFRDPSDPFQLLSDDEVKDELKLTDSQKEDLKKLEEEIREAEQDQPRPEFPRDDPAAQTSFFADMQKRRAERSIAAMTKIKAVLAENQYQRLEQVRFQKMGPQAFATEPVSTELKLSDSQKQSITATLEELRATQFNFQIPREEKEQALKDANAKILALLSADQKSSWEKKLGPALKPEEGSNQNSPAAAPATGTTTAAPTPKATYTPPENDGPSVISFDGGKTVASNDATGKTPAPAVAATTTKTPSAPPDKEKSIQFHLENAPWEMVLKEFAKRADLQLQILDLPPGSVTYTNDKSWYTPDEALDILHGYLLQQGYIMIQRDRFLVIMTPDNRPIPPNLIPNITAEDLEPSGKYGKVKHTLLSVVLPLQGAEANDAAREVEMLKGPQGSVVPLGVSNSLVVMDTATNLRRIKNLLKGVTNVDPEKLEFKSFPLDYVSADDAVILVKEQLGVPAATSSSDRSRFQFPFGQFGSSNNGSSSRSSTPTTPTAKVTAEPRTNAVLVTATTLQLALAEQILKTIDISEDDVKNKGAIGMGTPFLRVYHLKNADADEVQRTIDSIMPGFIINSDDHDDSLHVKANQKQHDEIARLIGQLDGGSTETVTVIPLSKLDPVGAMGMLNGLFAADGDAAPSIQADTLYGRRLVVRGSADQVAQVRLILESMGEDGTGTGTDIADKGPFRTIPLGGRDAEEFVRILEQYWGRTSATPIRIVIPSASPIRGRSVPSATSEGEFDMLRPFPATQSRPKASKLDQNSTAVPKKPLYEVSAQTEDQDPAPAKAEVPGETQASTAPISILRVNKIGEMMLNDDNEVFGSATRLSIRLGEWLEATPEKDRKFILSVHPETPALKLTPILAVLTARGVEYSMEMAPDDEEAPAEPQPESPAEDLLPEGNAQSGDAPKKNQPTVTAGSKKLPITLTVRGGELLLYDPNGESQSLDQMETMIEQLALAIPPRTTWTVYYLRSAEVTETAGMLEQLFPSSSVTTSVGDDGSIFGGLTNSISSLGGSLVDAAGLNSLTNNPASLRIIPELRSNSLFVSGPVDQVRQVEEMLRVLDADDLPETLRERVPRMIPVEYANVNEVATIVKDVYRDYLEDANERNSRQNPLAAMMGGGGNSRSNNNNRNGAPTSVKMTIGVDAQTSKLVVSASDSLFRQVEEMVAELDKSAYEARRTVQVVNVNESSAQVVSQALTALLPNVTISTTSSTDRGSSNNNNDNRPSWGGGSSDDAERQARIQAYMQSRSQGGDSGRSWGGGDSGRSFGSGFSRGGDSGRTSFGGDSGRSFGSSRGYGGGDSGRSFGRGGDSGRGR